jgi:putative colanic acid biosynthesis acetyltransferase WcaF
MQHLLLVLNPFGFGTVKYYHMKMQDLSLFKMPDHFRGRPGWYVQLWWITEALLFRPSPQIFYGWRRFLLRMFGAQIGKKVIIRPTVKMTYPWKVKIGDYSWIGDDVVLYSLGEIVIGNHVVISQRSYICTGSHDYTKSDFLIYARPIHIEDESWLATDVFIGPGVIIGKASVVGARSSVYKNTEGGMVYAGNPAVFMKNR